MEGMRSGCFYQGSACHEKPWEREGPAFCGPAWRVECSNLRLNFCQGMVVMDSADSDAIL